MKIRSRVFMVVFVILLAASITSFAEQTVSDLIEEVAGNISSIQTLREKGVWKMEFEMQGMKQTTEMETEIVYERPNRLFMRSQHFVVICDGSNAYLRVPMTRRYHKLPIGESLAELLEGSTSGLLSGLMPDTKALISKDPAAVLRETAENARVEILPGEEIGGRDCHVLIFGLEEGHGPFEKMAFRVWVDKEYGLVRRMESIPPDPADTAPDDDEDEEDSQLARMMRSMKIRLEVTELVVNGPVSDEEFVFKPEPGEKEVETEYGLMGDASGQSAGFSSFELSGQKAPDFTLSLLDGEEFTLSTHTGSVVLIDFWATWCGPCVKALPDMKKLDEEYREKGLVVIGVSRDRAGDEEKISKMFEKHELAYPTGIDVSGIADAYKVRGIPCLVLIDQKGVVQGRKVGFGPGGLDGLKKDIEAVLGGQEIEAAKPMSEEELKETQAVERERPHWRGETKLDANAFLVRWERKVQTSGDRTHDREPVNVRIPPRYLIARDENRLFVFDPESGNTNRIVELPEQAKATNEMGNVPTLRYLETPDGGAVVGVQMFYKIEGEGSRKSYRSDRVEIIGIALNDEVTWTNRLGKDSHVRSVDVLPISEQEDVLLISTWNSFQIINARGETLLTQQLEYRDRIDIYRSDSESGLSGYLQGGRTAAFELVIPAGKEN